MTIDPSVIQAIDEELPKTAFRSRSHAVEAIMRWWVSDMRKRNTKQRNDETGRQG